MDDSYYKGQYDQLVELYQSCLLTETEVNWYILKLNDESNLNFNTIEETNGTTNDSIA